MGNKYQRHRKHSPPYRQSHSGGLLVLPFSDRFVGGFSARSAVHGHRVHDAHDCRVAIEPTEEEIPRGKAQVGTLGHIGLFDYHDYLLHSDLAGVGAETALEGSA